MTNQRIDDYESRTADADYVIVVFGPNGGRVAVVGDEAGYPFEDAAAAEEFVRNGLVTGVTRVVRIVNPKAV